MFESALLESSPTTSRGASLCTKALSFTLEALILGLAVLAPLLYTEALPRHVLSGILEAPAAPPAAAPPRSATVATHTQTHSELNQDRILLPSSIPQHAKQIHDEPAIDPAGPDDPVGVVGAPPNGSRGVNVARLLDVVPPAMPKIANPHSVRVSSGVAQGLLIHQVRPQYPSLARSARVQGAVILQATIARDGTIKNLHLLSGHPLLTQAAIEAVQQWRYRPYLLNNEPVEVDTTIQVNFTLGGAN